MAFRLKLREPLPEGLKRVFCEQIDSALHMCQNPAKQRGVTVHDVRKHLKKLRAAMRLAIGAVGKNCHAEEDRCVRKIGRLVSDLRDAHARLQTFIKLRDKWQKIPDNSAFRARRNCWCSNAKVFPQHSPAGKRKRSHSWKM